MPASVEFVRSGGASANLASCAGLLTFQQKAGNRAVAAMLQRHHPVVQRADAEEGSPGHRPPLDEGAKGPAVKLLQQKLSQQGARYAVPATGNFGPTTHKAVVRYQQDHPELHPATGGVGSLTWASLDAAPDTSAAAEGSPGHRPPLDEGAKGPAVKLLQQKLSQHGYFLPTTGTFGPATHKAVVRYQEDHPELHPATGGVGPLTWASLDAAPDAAVGAGEIDDGLVKELIRAALWNTDKKKSEEARCFDAWAQIVRQRESETPNQPGNINLAAAEHYLYARYSSAGYTPAILVDVGAIVYQVHKALGGTESRPNAPAVTPPSLGQLKWETLGAHDGAWTTIEADKQVPFNNPRATVGPKGR